MLPVAVTGSIYLNDILTRSVKQRRRTELFVVGLAATVVLACVALV